MILQLITNISAVLTNIGAIFAQGIVATGELENNLPDIPRIFTALAECLACIVVVLSSKRRFGAVKTSLLFILFLLVQCGFQLLVGRLAIGFWIPGMIAAVILMCVFIYACCDISWLRAGYLCLRAFIMAEFAAALEWQLYCYYLLASGDSLLFNLMFLIPIYAAIFIAFFLLERKFVRSDIHISIAKKDFVSALTIVVAVFIISNISFVSHNTPFSSKFGMEIFYIRSLVNFCGILIMRTQQEQRLWLQSKRELYAMQNIMDRQFQQYCQSKESIELINITYHDLKHQIAVIREEKNLDKREVYLERMDKNIRMYEAQNKTGNSVFDTVLTSKGMICAESEINLTCVADGKLLDFMDVMDVCSIIGNALDNAIENVRKIVDKEKRLIKVAVYSYGQFLMIRIENYFENELAYEKGLLTTTKNEKEKHGYGIKSIKITAEKYGGTVKIKTDNNWFELYILIPQN